MILILYIILLFGLWIGFQWLKNKRSKLRQTKDFEDTFKNAQIKSPTLEIGTSYSWPTFAITFSSKEDLEFAESNGLIEQFKKKLRRYYDQDFDPDRALHCTYVGHVPAWKGMFEEKTNETNPDND
jgi:hypothetical protein